MVPQCYCIPNDPGVFVTFLVASSFPRRFYLPAVATRYPFGAGWTKRAFSQGSSVTLTIDRLRSKQLDEFIEKCVGFLPY